MERASLASPFSTHSSSAIGTAADWILGLLTGSLAISLCVIAIAMLGLLMLSGRLPLLQGLRTMIGCFVVLGAPVIASGLIGAGENASPREIILEPAQTSPDDLGRTPLPQANYDPYAGASLRNDH